jgi:hypothetical protein
LGAFCGHPYPYLFFPTLPPSETFFYGLSYGLFERFYVLKRLVIAEIKLIEDYAVDGIALSTGVCCCLCPMTEQIMLQDAPQDCLTSLDIYVLVHKNKRVVLLTSKLSVRLGERIWKSPPPRCYVPE